MTAPVPRVWVLSATLLAVTAGTAVAGLHGGVVETVYTSPSVLTVPTSFVVPTSFTYALPTVYTSSSTVLRTSFLTPTAYVTPTAFVTPTSFVSTSYVAPTYYTTSVWVPRRFRRRAVVDVLPTSYYVPTIYVTPTSTLWPTTIGSPLMTTAETLCCNTTPVCTTEAPAVVQPSTPAGSNASGNPDESASGETPRLNTDTIRSSPRNGGVQAPARTTPVPPARPSDGSNEDVTPPGSPAPDGGGLVNPPGDEGAERHQAMRPAFAGAPSRRVSLARSLLRVKIISPTTGKGEKGVKVSVEDARRRFLDKTPTTDDNGQFTVMLPEGDWTVKVPKPDGKAVDEYPITVAGGVITDSRDREVSIMNINR